MTRIRDIANILSSSTSMATDAEVTSAISAQNMAGKNKIINGDFGIWQRGTSFSNPATGSFQADRWSVVWNGTGATRTISRQTFVAGNVIPGYEFNYFYRFAQSVAGTGASYNLFQNRIEDVTTYAGQTVTISFWAKAAANTNLAQLNLEQDFGTGGSPSATISNSISTGTITITTSWQRFSYTTTVPSISGKTIGTTTPGYLGFRVWVPINETFTLDFVGFQIEAGSTATNFTTSTGTIQGELAACQRYYQTSFDLGQTPAHNGSYYGEMTLSCVNGGFNTNSYGAILFPTKMRNAPTVNIWNTRNASVSGNSARFYNSGTAYETSSIDMGITTSSSHGMTFKGTNIGSSAIVFFGYSASAEL
jgi:hypothetical protein